MSTKNTACYSIVNNKGGVGKTTTTQSIAAALRRRDKHLKILLIDLDPQSNLSLLCGWSANERKNDRTVYDALRNESPLPVYKNEKGDYYVPSSPYLQQVDSDLARQMSPKEVLAGCLGQPVEDHTGENIGTVDGFFDYVFIDCPPALSESTYNAMAVSDGVLIPVQAEPLSVNGLGSIIVEMNRVKAKLNTELQLLGILPTIVDGRPGIVKGFLDYLHNIYGDKVCKTMIRRCVKVQEAQSQLKDIFQYAPYCTTAMDYEKAVAELFYNGKK